MSRPVRGGVAAALTAVLAAGAAGAAVPAGALPSAAGARAAVPSSTSLSVEGQAGAPVAVAYGQGVTLAAQVAVGAGAPDGWVYFVVDGVARRTDVAADGTAATAVVGLGVGTHRLAATFVPRDPAQQDGSSSAEVAVEVTRAATEPRVRVAGTRVTRAVRVLARVRAAHGTTPTGRVAATLRQRGGGVSRVRTRPLADGAAELLLGRLAAGRYSVVVRYAGDRRHLSSRERRVFRVRGR